MPIATKKKAVTKPPAVKPAPAAIAKAHPAWIDIIKECITAHPDDARIGVSRPMIKKFAEDQYKISTNPTTVSQLTRAISAGTAKGVLVLPKGPSGRIKLAPKASRPDGAKENKPAAKPKPSATKASTKTAQPAKRSTSSAVTKGKAGTKTGTKAKPTTTAKAKPPPTKPRAASSTKGSSTKLASKSTPAKQSTSAPKSPKPVAAKTPVKKTTPPKKVTSKKTTPKEDVLGIKNSPFKPSSKARKPVSASATKPASKTKKPSSKRKLAE